MHGCGLVKGEGFAVDASVMEANASRYHGKAPDEIDWSEPKRQTRAVAEFLSGLDDEDPARRSQATEGDLADRSVLGVDGEGQQARPVRLWAQLSDRHRDTPSSSMSRRRRPAPMTRWRQPRR